MEILRALSAAGATEVTGNGVYIRISLPAAAAKLAEENSESSGQGYLFTSE